MQIKKLGTIVRDLVTETEGMLTHLCVSMVHNKQYIYQPKGLNPETGQPVDPIFVEESRIENGVDINVELPLEVLGSKAEDRATGFRGTIVELIYHINGCIHVQIKPSGTIKSTGATVTATEFDIRRVEGDMIVPFTEKELEVSRKEKPSPTPTIPKNQR